VDNGAASETTNSLPSVTVGNMKVRCLHEPRKGKSHALNTGLRESAGEVILFLDDDTIPTEDWAERMVTTLLTNGYDAVTGEIAIAPSLERPWLTSAHRWWLASSNDAKPYRGSRELIGANMALRRSALEKLREFDPELGPGALGLSEDTLFGWQLIEAGLKIGYAAKARVTHQPDDSRLTRQGWLAEARKHGRGEAYLRYHWEHSDISSPRLRELYYFMKLHLRRALRRPPRLEEEGCPVWEMSYVLQIEKCRQFRRERRRPRNYAQHGLTRLVPLAQEATSRAQNPRPVVIGA
jgi:cellulose synthase/poly-beta-1,6-N-acetylglucosamine synthase-like glycosyltransferase